MSYTTITTLYTRFYLEGADPAYLRVSLKLSQGNYYRFYLPGEKIEKKYWSRKDQRALKSYPEYRSLNDYLTYIQRECNQIRRELDMKGQLTIIEAQRAVVILIHKKADNFWDQYAQFLTETKRRSKMQYAKFSALQNHLESWNNSIKFNDINLENCHRFAEHLFAKGLNVNTVAKYFSLLRSYMDAMAERGHHSVDSYRKFEIKRYSPKMPYLTIPEINLLYQHRGRTDGLENARLNLLIGCYSGQRHSDWYQIRTENLMKINGKECFHVLQKKGGGEVFIPAHDKLKEIVARNPYHISNQKINSHLKELCKDVGIDSVFIRPSTRGNVLQKTVHKKYELVASHIGRRSFICNSILSGIPHEVIMKVSGHKSYNIFKQYIQLSSSDGLEQFDDLF